MAHSQRKHIYGCFPFTVRRRLLRPCFWRYGKAVRFGRGLGLYSVTIFLVEFAAGGLIRLATGVCPWDYGNNPLSVLGLIRLDYAPLWAALGCFFEEVSLLLAKKGELA